MRPAARRNDYERRNMGFKVSKKEPRTIIVLGFALLAIAQIGSFLLQRKSGLPENIADFGTGLLEGVAIGTLLLGVWLFSRSKKR